MSFVCCGYSINVCLVMSFSLIALHCIASCSRSCHCDLVHVLLALFDGLPIALPYIHASALVASHLDTLDGQRVDVKHMMAEPNHKMALVDIS